MSTDAATPSLAGQDPQYLAHAIKAYRTTRKNDTMSRVVASLSDQDIDDIVAFYATQKSKPAEDGQTLLTDITAKCNRCHAGDIDNPALAIPIINGQDKDYLVLALRAYRDGKRGNSLMHNMSVPYGDAIIESIASYYAKPAGEIGANELAGRQIMRRSRRQNSRRPGRSGSTGRNDREVQDALVRMQRSMKKLLILLAVVGAAIGGHCHGGDGSVRGDKPGDDMRTLNADADGHRRRQAPGGDGLRRLPRRQRHQHHPEASRILPASGRPISTSRSRNIRSGVRSNDAMTNAVKFLSDDALIKVAAYFASLDPAPLPAAPAGPAKPDPVEAGKAASAACAGCHGNTGVSQIPGIPSLIGLDPKYLVDAMKAYKNGQRKNDTMKAMLARVERQGDEQRRAVLRAAKAGARQDAGRRRCGRRQGRRGKLRRMPRRGRRERQSGDAEPRRTGRAISSPRRCRLQGRIARQRYDEGACRARSTTRAMKNLAAYFAAQQPKAPNVRKPLTTAEWVERCNRCHGVNGNSTDPRFPMLASQRVEYLQKALLDYRAHDAQEHTRWTPWPAG